MVEIFYVVLSFAFTYWWAWWVAFIVVLTPFILFARHDEKGKALPSCLQPLWARITEPVATALFYFAAMVTIGKLTGWLFS